MNSSPAPPSPAMTALQSLSSRQRVGLAVLAVAVIGTLLWSTTRSATDLVALSADRPRTLAESRDLKKKLRAAGLTDFSQSGDQILVPRAQVADYQAVVSGDSIRSGDWAAEWERQNARLSPFSGSRARDTSREIARARHTAAMLRQLPDIEQADVVWDEDAQPGWRQQPRCRATVYLQPMAGRELSLQVIRAVRLAVAGSKKHLDPADVTIMDVARQVTYDGSEAALVGEHLLPQLRVLADLYRRQINNLLHDVAGAKVTVDVDFPRFFDFLSTAGSEDTNSESGSGHDIHAAALAAVAPRMLRVIVSVPASDTVLLQTPAARSSFETSIRERLTPLFRGAGHPHRTSGFDAAQVTISLPPLSPPVDRPQQPAVVAALSGLPKPVLYGIGSCAALTALFLLISGRRRSHNTQRSTTETFADSHSAPPDDFDDLAQLDQQALATLYTQTTPTCWAIALRGASPDVAQRLTATLATKTVDELQQHCDALGPVRLRDVQSSQNRIIEALHQTRHDSGSPTVGPADEFDPLATSSV